MTDPDYAGQDRRDASRAERIEEFRLRRDKALLYVGLAGFLLMAGLNSTVGFRDIGVALALIAAFGAMCGLPTALRLDERRRDRREET